MKISMNKKCAIAIEQTHVSRPTKDIFPTEYSSFLPQKSPPPPVAVPLALQCSVSSFTTRQASAGVSTRTTFLGFITVRANRQSRGLMLPKR